MPSLLAPILLWLGVASLLCGVLAKVLAYVRLPRHLRWELYPIPHEGARAAHGGSYLENLDWWTRPLPHDRGAMLRAMAVEIVTLKGVREHNPRLWAWSFPFHLGLYLLAASSVLLAAGGLVEVFGGVRLASAGPLGQAAHRLTFFLEVSGGLLALIGTAGLLARRLADRDLRAYTPPAALLNLAFLLALVLVGLAARYLADPTAALLRARVGEILSFQFRHAGVLPDGTVLAAGTPWLVDFELCLFAVFAGYLPYTFMSHAFMKFFTWHSVRWDDRPRRPGEPTDPRLTASLRRPASWSAPHAGGGGGRTWGEIVSGPPEEKKP